MKRKKDLAKTELHARNQLLFVLILFTLSCTLVTGGFGQVFRGVEGLIKKTITQKVISEINRYSSSLIHMPTMN